MPEVHALLSASSSKRWLTCTPSARLESRFPDSTSAYAEEGTKAHALAERRLRKYLEDGKLSSRRLPYTDPEMWDAVGQYVDICVEKINQARKDDPAASVFVEQRLDFSPWVPEGFGTGDLVVMTEDYIEVVDLKYGKGVPVDADHNTQMMLYALGAWYELYMVYAPIKVNMTIVQPRLDSASTFTMTLDDLKAWGESIKPTAKKAFEGEGEPVAGPHCQFCRCRKTCRALSDYMLEYVKTDLKPCDITPAELAETVLRAKEIKKWLTELEEYALAEALNGTEWPGLKVVEGRSVRSFTDTVAVSTTLQQAGFKPEEIFKPQELQTLTSIEKLVGKKAFPELLGKWVEKPQGKPTLAAEDDKRPAMMLNTVTDDDFNDDFEDDLTF